jgi:hypothetical protein
MIATGSARDERGAIMVIALFFAIFGVAMLYTLVGTAQTIFLRERLQDAADSAALSGAVVQARSMNLLVLINIVMAALLAILVTLKAVESVAILGIILASAFAWITGGATLSAVPPLKTLQQEMHQTYADLKPPIYDALKTLHEASEAVQSVAPVTGLAMVEADIATHSAPAVGFVAPSRFDLPVEDDTFAVLCGKAGKLPGDIASQALTEAGIPVVPKVTEVLFDGVGALAESFSGWFCGDTNGNGGSGDAPKLSRIVEQSYPKVVTADSELCSHVDTDGPTDSSDEPSDEEVEDACERSKDEEDAGKPDDQTGGCRKGVDCSLEGPYESRIKLAREQCDPTASPQPFAYWHQQRTGHVVYEWTQKGWMRHEPLMSDLVRVGGEKGSPRPPCGPKGLNPLAVGYNKIVHPHDDLAETLPACTTEKAPILPPEGRVRGTLAPQDFLEVTQILGCQKYESKDIPITAGEQAGEQSSDKSPKKLEENVVMGDENFQLRSLMWAPSNDSARSIVELALWKTGKPDEPLELLQPLRGLAVAQAEYFYDGSDENWLWSMSWRARLRRFRLEDDEFEKIQEACKGMPEAMNCKAALTALANTVNVINH